MFTDFWLSSAWARDERHKLNQMSVHLYNSRRPHCLLLSGSVLTCPSLSSFSLEHGKWRIVNGSHYEYGTKIIFTCNPGYYRAGPAHIQCLANGVWSWRNERPRCRSESQQHMDSVKRHEIQWPARRITLNLINCPLSLFFPLRCMKKKKKLVNAHMSPVFPPTRYRWDSSVSQQRWKRKNLNCFFLIPPRNTRFMDYDVAGLNKITSLFTAYLIDSSIMCFIVNTFWPGQDVVYCSSEK